MPLCALLAVFGAFVAVLGKDLPFLPTEKTDHRLTAPEGFQFKDLCFFGVLPSTACEEKCEALRMVAYCYKGTNECLCKPSKGPVDDHASAGDHVTSGSEQVDNNDELNDNVPIILYISDFIRLRPFVAGTEEEDYDGDSENAKGNALPSGMHPDAIPTYDEDDFLWSKEHLAMVLIVVMLLALVAVELCIIYRKRKSNNYLENLLQRTALDKGMVASFK